MRKLGSLLYLILFYSILAIAAIARYNNNHSSKTENREISAIQSTPASSVTLNEDFISRTQFKGNDKVDTSFYYNPNYATLE